MPVVPSFFKGTYSKMLGRQDGVNAALKNKTILQIKEDECEEEECLGRGSEGTVHLVKHKDFGRVAMKRYFQTIKKMNNNEIEFLLKTRHPLIVTIYGVLSETPNVYKGYIMEYMEFGSLDAVIFERKIKYDQRQVHIWIQQGARALKHLHDKGIIHRDVKPHNFLVSKNMDIKLADLGLARNVQANHMTMRVGTLSYMAPEVNNLMTEESYGIPSDVYSFSTTIFAMYCRQESYLHEKHSRLDDEIPEKSQKILKRGWDIQPIKRPHLAEFIDLAEELLRSDKREDSVPQQDDRSDCLSVRERVRMFEARSQKGVNPQTQQNSECSLRIVEMNPTIIHMTEETLTTHVVAPNNIIVIGHEDISDEIVKLLDDGGKSYSRDENGVLYYTENKDTFVFHFLPCPDGLLNKETLLQANLPEVIESRVTDVHLICFFAKFEEHDFPLSDSPPPTCSGSYESSSWTPANAMAYGLHSETSREEEEKQSFSMVFPESLFDTRELTTERSTTHFFNTMLDAVKKVPQTCKSKDVHTFITAFTKRLDSIWEDNPFTVIATNDFQA